MFETYKAPLYAADRNVCGTSGFSRDITERKQAERGIRELNERLEARVRQRTTEVVASNKQLEDFACVASHDLQEALRMVSRYVQMLEQRLAGKLDSGIRQFMGFAVDGGSTFRFTPQHEQNP